MSLTEREDIQALQASQPRNRYRLAKQRGIPNRPDDGKAIVGAVNLAVLLAAAPDPFLIREATISRALRWENLHVLLNWGIEQKVLEKCKPRIYRLHPDYDSIIDAFARHPVFQDVDHGFAEPPVTSNR